MGAYEDTFGAGANNPAQSFAQNVAQLEPYVTSFSSSTGQGTFEHFKTPTAPAGDALSTLGNWVGSIGKTALGVGAWAASGLADAAVNTIKGVTQLPGDIVHGFELKGQIDANYRQTQALSAQVSQLSNDYRSGRISNAQYKKGLNDLNGQFDQMNKDNMNTLTDAQNSTTQAWNDFNITAQTIIGVATAGLGEGLPLLGAKVASGVGDGSAVGLVKYFTNSATEGTMFNAATKIDAIAQDAANVINKYGTFNGKFSTGIIAKITHEAATTGGEGLTAQQIAKNVAVNLLLKRPLIYQTNVDLASSIYKDMTKGDIRGAAFNTVITAGMALSGGPIGFAMESLGKGGGKVLQAMFPKNALADFMTNENKAALLKGEPLKYEQSLVDQAKNAGVGRQAVIDAMSAFVGDGTLSQGAEAIAKLESQGKTDLLNKFMVTLETNLRMTNGNAVQAAGLVRDFYNGLDGGRKLASMSFEDLVTDMGKWAANREKAVQSAIKDGGMTPADAQRIVIGRADEGDKQMIIDALMQADKSIGDVYDHTLPELPTSSATTKVPTAHDNEILSALGAPKGGIKDLVNSTPHTPTTPITTLNKERHAELVQARLDILQSLASTENGFGRLAAWANNDNFMTKLQSIIKNPLNADPQSLAKEIMKIKAGKEFMGVSQEVADQLAKDGYIAILPKNRTYTPYVSESEVAGKKLATSFGKDAQESTGFQSSLFEQAVKPVGGLATVGTFLTRIGLSPEASNGLVQKYLGANFEQQLQQVKGGFTNDMLKNMKGDDIMNTLYNYVRNFNAEGGDTMLESLRSGDRMPITDLRQMSLKEIQSAFKAGRAGIEITKDEAKQIAGAINTSYLQVPIAVRGLGDKVQDINMAKNPFAPMFSRIQGATRFVYNPFFRLQQSYQTEGLAQMESIASTGAAKRLQLPGINRVANILYPRGDQEISNTIDILAKKNIFPAGYTGIGGAAAIEGQVGSRIILSEKRSLAGLVNVLAKNRGLSPQDYVNNHELEVVDLLRTMTIANHTAGKLDSPLVRSINLAFFPFRYNMKVAGLMADYVSKMPASMQVAFLHSFFNMQGWLQSNEGLAWQQQNADAINFFSWLSPTYPIGYLVKIGQDAIHPADAHLSDFGLIGGLPFGMISQMLNAQGIIDTQGTGINLSTGEAYPKYTPTTIKGQVSTAIQDLIGAVWTYPGAIVGLPSKTKITSTVTDLFTGANTSTDYKKSTGNLTPGQLHDQPILQQSAGTASAPALPSTQFQTPQSVTMPMQKQPTAAPRPSSKTSGGKKKKADFRPAALPPL